MILSHPSPRPFFAWKDLFVFFEIAIAVQLAAAGQPLLNIDFGMGSVSAKQGSAAIGQSPVDFWNLYSRDGSSEVPNLAWADGLASPVDLVVANAPGAWGNGSSDPMFGVYLYPFDGGNITVTLSELPVADYALYVYAHGTLDGEYGVVDIASGGNVWGPVSLSGESGWNTLAWEAGRQYAFFDSIVVGKDGRLTITVSPSSTGLAIINGIQLIQHQSAPAYELINVDFSGHQNPSVRAKLGPAAVGQTAEDIWNLYSRDDGQGGFLSSAGLVNLLAADGTPTGADLGVRNAPGLWIASHPDAMMDSYLYPSHGEDMVVAATNLAAGQYDLYFYSHGLLDEENSQIHVRVGRKEYGARLTAVSSNWQSFPWQEGVQYVLFRELEIPAYATLTITVSPGSTGLAIMNGMQLVRKPVCASPSGLVAWWRGEGDALDEVGSHHGELLNNTAFAAGRVGQGLMFDGVDDAVQVEYSSELVLSNLTIEAWVKPLSPVDDADYAQELIFGQAFGYPQLVVRNGNNGIRVRLSLAENPSTFMVLESTEEIPVDEFSHVAATWDGSVMKLYVNGSPAGEMTPGRLPTPTTCPFFIGGWQDACGFTGGFFNGVIDELSLYSRALSAAEIYDIYGAGQAGKCVPPSGNCVPPAEGIVGWWRGESNAEDVVGGHDGELRNGLGFAAGQVGQAFDFSAQGQHVLVPASDDFAVDSLTLEAWIFPDPAKYWEQQPIAEFAEPTGPAGAHLWLSVLDGGGFESAGALYANVRSVSGESYFIGTPPNAVAAGQWSHVSLTYDSISGMGVLYVNGSPAVSRYLGSFEPQTRQPLYIGYRPEWSADGGGGYTFGGRIDELSLYNRALTPIEINSIYAAGGVGKCPPTHFGLHVNATPGGTVLRDPDETAYLPGTTVTLTALAEEGYIFDRWEGDATGTDPEVTLLMDETKQVTAVFVDVRAPEVEIESPTPGITEIESSVLSGRVTDNLAVGSAWWEWNGEFRGSLWLSDNGEFRVEGLQLRWGENLIRVAAVDAAGNQANAEVLVEWVPARILFVVNPDPRQEGQRVHVPIQLASAGDVGGASFILNYDAEYLKNPELEWAPALRSALNQVNTDLPDQLRATFALPALAVPSGTQTLAVVSFRARSVPESLISRLDLQLLDVSNPQGDSIVPGSTVLSGQTAILVRRLVGDNNANHRLDVGDATIIQRLLAGLEMMRPWDGIGNDVNQNSVLDSGDVIRVLRAVVGLDPQPLPQSASETTGIGGLANQGLQPMETGSLGSMALEADHLRAAPGDLITVRVLLADMPASISAISLYAEYPPEALRLLNPQSHRVGEAVPATAVAIWNVAPAQTNYTLQSGVVSVALSSALPWPSSEGVVAELVFQVQEGQSSRYQWPIHVRQAEHTPDGYDMTILPDATLYYVGREPLTPQLTPMPGGLTEEGFAFSFLGEPGLNYVVEVSTDLVQWTPLATRAGADELITILDADASGAEHRFYRVLFE